MSKPDQRFSIISSLKRFRFRRVFYIALFWTVIDTISTALDFNTHEHHTKSLFIRAMLVFLMSGVMGYLFVFTLKSIFRNSSMGINFLVKAVILLLAALVMNFLVHFVDGLVAGRSITGSFEDFYENTMDAAWMLKRTLYWMILFVVTQLYVEINDKYAPGVFIDILLGKYIQPKIENRIVMFIDLKDSTPVAEKLGHKQYFLFIREFIYHVSLALIEHNGIIYQYVGDEIVVSWKYNKKNMKECIVAILQARRNIQKKSDRFRELYGTIPEFHIGINLGDVTVGEIGVIKKDLAMSGDTMNTAARIRSSCDELNEKFLVSKEFAEKCNLKDWQLVNLGMVELKGKAEAIELYALRI
jgi:adenylate cyclase